MLAMADGVADGEPQAHVLAGGRGPEGAAMKFGWGRQVALALVALCFTAPAQAGKTLVYCSEASPSTLNAAMDWTATLQDIGLQIQDRLVGLERGTTTMVPDLAESWEISPDGRKYTFHLRRGVKFHTTPTFRPTRDFNAEDVLFTFERQWKKDHSFHQVSGGTYPYFEGAGLADVLRSIERVDDYTIRFVLHRPEAPFLAHLTTPMGFIHSAEYADAMMRAGTPEKVDLEPVGTGPFQLVGYQKDVAIRLQAHPDYWAGKAPLDHLVFAITPNASVRYLKLRAGECHVIPYPNPADLPAMREDPDLEVLSAPGLNVGGLYFNTAKKPFDDRRVRQALWMAIDKPAILDAVFEGTGVSAKSRVPPALWGHDDELQDYPHDPAKARALLEEAGVSHLTTDLSITPVQRSYNPNARRMAELIQADWAGIGVDAEIVSYEWGEYLKGGAAGEFETMLIGWIATQPDPNDFLYTYGCNVGSANWTRWCHEPFDDLLTRARRIVDQDARTELYRRAQVIFKEEAPSVPIAHALTIDVVRKEVIDYRPDPLSGHVFYGVDLRP